MEVGAHDLSSIFVVYSFGENFFDSSDSIVRSHILEILSIHCHLDLRCNLHVTIVDTGVRYKCCHDLIGAFRQVAVE